MVVVAVDAGAVVDGDMVADVVIVDDFAANVPPVREPQPAAAIVAIIISTTTSGAGRIGNPQCDDEPFLGTRIRIG